MDFSRMPVVVLPKINGPEAYARMIAERPDVRVIFATGRVTPAPGSINRLKWIIGRIRKDF